MADERIQVQCYPNAGGDPLPKVVVQGALRRDITEVLERWSEELRDPDYGRRRWFRVRFLDGTSATIYQDLPPDAWYLRRRTIATPEIGSPAGN